MRILLLFIFPFALSAQLSNTPKIIYKAGKSETVIASFSPSGEARLYVKAGEVIDDNIELSGYRVHTILLDSGETIIAMAKGIVGYTIYRDGVNVTPVAVADNSEAEIIAFVDGLSTARLKKLIAGIVIINNIPVKRLKKYLN